MKKLYVMQDSALNQKDLSYGIEDHIKSINPAYQFKHSVTNLYRMEWDNSTNELVILHRLVPDDYANAPDTSLIKRIKFEDIDTHLITHDNVYVMACNFTSPITDQEILASIGLYTFDDTTGNITDLATNTLVSPQDGIMNCFNIVSLFKLKNIPVVSAIVNNGLIIQQYPDEFSFLGNIVRHSAVNKNMKNNFLDPVLIGAEEVIGKENIFLRGNTLTLDLYTTEVKQLIIDNNITQADLTNIANIKTNVPYTFDGQLVVLDFTTVPTGSSAFFKIELIVNNFIENFLYESQRPYYEYNIYKLGV